MEANQLHSVHKPEVRSHTRLSLRRYRPLLRYVFLFMDVQAGMLICSLFGGLMGIMSPYITKLIFDYAYANRDFQLLIALAATSLVLQLLPMASSAIQQYLQLYASQSLAFQLRTDFLKHLYALPLSYFQSRSTGEHIYRLNADVSATASFAGGIISQLANPFISTVFPLCAILWMDWRFAVLAAIVTPIFSLHARFFGHKQRELAREVAIQSQNVSSKATDRIAQIKLVKSFGREQRELREYLSNQIKLIRLTYRQYWLGLRSSTTSSLMNTVLQSGLALYLGYRVVSGQITVGTLIALSMYTTQLLGATRSLAGLYQGLLSQLIPVDRFLDVMEQAETVADRPGAAKLERIEDPIRFDGVSFSYDAVKPVLTDLNLTILPGQMVAIIGPSGVGKTTILNLLLRLYEPSGGAIRIGARDIRDIKLAHLRKNIGVALQETYLFNATILENVRYGNPAASDNDVIEAALLADAHGFIQDLSEGYNTTVGESGCNLSMGQRQRIGIARALLKKPSVLILDEATASVNSESESTVLHNVRSLSGERTLIVITHRLTAIQDADRIFVLDGGRIAEEGTHDELLARKRLYFRLWHCQFGGADSTIAHTIALDAAEVM